MQRKISPTRVRLLTHYCGLLALAFSDQQFYAPQEMALWTLPDARAQRCLLATFHEHVSRALLLAEQQAVPLTRRSAWGRVLQQLEERLLHHSSDP